MADEPDETGSRKFHRLKGKFSTQIKTWRSSRLKNINNKRNIGEIKIDHEYTINENTPCPPAPAPVNIHVSSMPDVALNIDVKDCDTEDINWYDGRRVIEIKHLADQMHCSQCQSHLHLSDISGETRYGLGSIFSIPCSNVLCGHVNHLSSGKRNSKGAFDINTKVAIGMVHSGMGPSHVVNFLSACNIPPPDPSTIKKKEKEIYPYFKRQATESCNSAVVEECEAVQTEELECSFDAGWQTRGSGWQYSSNSGHASLVGIHTGKIIDFDVRNKKCSICQYYSGRNETVPNHSCNSNWIGSSKAMEPDMASSMLRNLRNQGYEVKTLHGDSDSTTMARIKPEFMDLKKKNDKNHFKKNLSKDFYKLSQKHKELKPAGVIPYLTRCFMYPISSKCPSPEDLAAKLEAIVPHLYGDHSHCLSTTWCTYHKSPSTYRYKHLPQGKPLHDEALRNTLDKIIEKLQNSAADLLSLGSTQANENFNNIVASKAPKNRCYGSTSSLASRVSAAVLQKNVGFTYVNKINEDAMLSPGKVTKKKGKALDKRKLWHKANNSKRTQKCRRLQLKKKNFKMETLKTVKEGQTYHTNISTSKSADIEAIPSIAALSEENTFIAFDIEATGLSRSSDLTQLAAYDGKDEFNVYIDPRQQISQKASEITGLMYSFQNNQMYLNGEEVSSINIHQALLDFLDFLKSKKCPVLVGHNIVSYDIPIMMKLMEEFGLLAAFLQLICGCIDTLKLSRKVFPKSQINNYKQTTLVKTFLGIEYDSHNALEDVKSLHRLFEEKLLCNCKDSDVFPFHVTKLESTFTELIQDKKISKTVGRRIANSGLGLKHLQLAFKRDPDFGVKSVLQERGFKGKTINAIQTILKDMCTEE